MKIKIDCWWTNPHAITDRVIKQFVTNPSQLDGIEFVYDNSYEALFVFGRPSHDTVIKSKDTTFCFTMEPLWSGNNSTHLHEISNHIIVHDKNGYTDTLAYKEHLVYMLYGGHGEINFAEPEYDWTYNNLINKKFDKNKSISTIVRNSYETHYNYQTDLYQTIYEDRVRIAEHLIQNDFNIDVYGQYWEENGKQIKGSIWNKMLGLNNYKFSISGENTIQKNYISEKFWDCILTDTIPIYFGCSNFSDYLNELDEFNFTSIIKDRNEIEYRLKHIISNENELYDKYLPIIKQIKNDYFDSKEYNIFLKIKDLIS